MGGDTVEAVVCFDLVFDSFVLVDHFHAAILQHDRRHHDVVEHFLRQLTQESLDDLIHAALGLE